MIGIGKNIQDIFNEQVVSMPFHTIKHEDIDRKDDIIRMIKKCNQCQCSGFNEKLNCFSDKILLTASSIKAILFFIILFFVVAIF